MDITLNISRPQLKMHKSWPIIVVVGIVALAIYLWAFVNVISLILNVGGVGSLLILLLLPAVTAYVTTTSVQKEIKSTKRILSIQSYMTSVLQRLAVLLAIAALILIPVVVIFYLYFQLYANAVFMGFVNCAQTNCAAFLPGAAVQQAPLVLLICIGLWGVNLLANVLTARLAIRGWDFVETFFGSLVLLAATVGLMYWLFTASKFTQWYLIVIAALLPYVLTVAIATISPRAPGLVEKKRR